MDFLKVFTALKINNAKFWADSCTTELYKFGITEDEDICRFLANAMNESGKFTTLIENLNYTTPQRLIQIFPSAFNSAYGGKYNASDYTSNPEKLGNLVYDSRLFPKKASLGNIYNGDGYLFRGRSVIQVTGRAIYKSVSDKTGINFVVNPDLLSQPQYAIIGAANYWQNNNCSKASSLLATRQIVAGQRGNSNPTGYTTVLMYYNQIKGAM